MQASNNTTVRNFVQHVLNTHEIVAKNPEHASTLGLYLSIIARIIDNAKIGKATTEHLIQFTDDWTFSDVQDFFRDLFPGFQTNVEKTAHVAPNSYKITLTCTN